MRSSTKGWRAVMIAMNNEDDDLCTNACQMRIGIRATSGSKLSLDLRRPTGGRIWVVLVGPQRWRDDAFEIYCDMTAAEGGWGLVYVMCQDGGGDARQGVSLMICLFNPMSHPVTSVPYNVVAAMSPDRVRYGSSFGEEPGYLFNWSNATSIMETNCENLVGWVDGGHSQSLCNLWTPPRGLLRNLMHALQRPQQLQHPRL